MNRKTTFLLSPLVLFILYITLSSSSTGITGQSVVGCTCHSASPSANTLVSISGLPSGGYVNGTVYPITVSVTNTVITPAQGGLGLRDGFDLSSTGGSFTAIANTALNGATEIRHTTPKAPTAGTASWTFNWTAPASGNANITFNLAGNATNGDGTNGGGNGTDMWNLTAVTLVKSGQALAVTASSSAILCNGGVSTITATGVGGIPPYTYKLNAGAFVSGNTFTGNLANTYTVTIKDASAATVSTLITLSQPSAISASASATTILCNGTTSSITVTASGGTGAFTYRLNAGTFQSSNIFAGNAAATYTITARDANLCTKTTTVVVAAAPSAITFAAPSITNPLCNGGTGGASISASGGTGTKTYTITPLGPQSNTTGVFTSLTAQVYTITATDANNCTKTTALTITAPSLITFASPSLSGPLCNGGTGSVNISASGGTGIKTYTITPLGPQSNTNGNFSGLTAQVYTITVTDANNCTKTTLINILQPAFLTMNAPVITQPLCNGGTGSVTSAGSGGTLSKTYTITPLGPQSNASGNFAGLTAQNYTITVTDGNACTATTTFVMGEPAPFIPTATNVSGCEGTAIMLAGFPGGGTFSVSNPYTGPSTTYTYTTTNANGCIGTSAPASIQTNKVTLDSIVASPEAVCIGGNSLLSVNLAGTTCIPSNMNNGCSGLEFISNVTFGSINNTTNCDEYGYKDYSNLSTNLTAGSTYTISLSDGAYFGGDQWGVWIDYNHNGIYTDVGEYTIFPASGTITVSNIIVPAYAMNGITKMRVRLTWAGVLSPCGASSWGETEDYSVIISGGVAQTAPYTYQWSNNLNSTILSPSSNTTLVNQITAAEHYAVTVTSAEGCTAIATVHVNMSTPNLIDSVVASPSNVCPGASSNITAFPVAITNACIPTVQFPGCNDVEFISNVHFGSINNSTPCDSIAYKDYSNLSTNITAGNSYSISLSDGHYFYGDNWVVFIDYNHNGILNDAGERYIFPAAGTITTGNILVPLNAYNGQTTMRIRLVFSGVPDPCSNVLWGEVEDYTVNITGGQTLLPAMSYVWSNPVNSVLNSNSGASVTASNITANETYHVTATDMYGCTESDSVQVMLNCGTTLGLTLFLQGFYNGSGTMVPALMNQGVGIDNTLTDTIHVELRDVISPYGVLASTDALLKTDGTALCTFPISPAAYYIAVTHRNCLQTWSKFLLNASTTFYNFSDSSTKAYGDNMVEVEPNIWAFYAGDLNGDENIDLLDMPLLEEDINSFVFGYHDTDMNGDGNVDLLDTPAIETNVNNFIFSGHP